MDPVTLAAIISGGIALINEAVQAGQAIAASQSMDAAQKAAALAALQLELEGVRAKVAAVRFQSV